MSIAVQGATRDSFEIKSATLPLLAHVLKSADLAALARDLEARFGDIPDCFDQDAMVIDLSRLEAGPERDSPTIDFPPLIELLKKYRLTPVAVHGGSAKLAAAALAAGLFWAPDARIGSAPPSGSSEAAVLAAAQAAVAAAAQAAVEAGLMPAPEARAGTQAEAPAQAAPAPVAAMVIDRPLRSGQQVYARGRDLVVLDMVNAGAEVIADGHIHVYAPLRGRAIAGARGNADARIFALSMEPELVSIAGLYRTGEAPLPAAVRGKPTQARLVTGPEGNRLVFDPLE